MKFLYFYRVPVPDPRADAVQIINTCAGIANAGGVVALHTETMAAASTAECLAFYGLAVPSGKGGALEVSAIGSHWSWPFFDWKVGGILRKHSGGRGCLFVREIRPYVPGLMARAKAAGLKVIFEAHNVSASLIKEKHGKIAGGSAPYTFSMVTPEGKTALKLTGESPAHDDGHGHAHGHEDGHDDKNDHHAAPEAPPNLDESPAPPPRPAVEDAAARRMRLKAEERAQLEATIVTAADGLICTQKATLSGLEHLVRPGTPTMVLGNGACLPPARPAVAKDIDVLYCGSLKPWKGVDTLIAAMQTLYPYKLTIVGPGTREDFARVRQAALAVGVIERVKILPAVKPAEVWGLYARAKVGVIPLPDAAYVEARDFTSPLKLFEMMAAGLPIVCSRLKSLQEYVSDGREALMVTADDPRPLAEGLRKLLTDETLRNGLAAAALARAGEFTWDARGRKIADFASQLFG